MAVRREKVILEVEDHATNPLLRSAAAAKTLDKSLNDLDRSSVRGSVGMDRISHSAVRADRDINKLTGRLRLFADVAAVLGPTLVPIGAVAIPMLTGLAAQFGAAAVAGGTAIIAFQGVGDTLKAVNEAALEPSAANLEKAREALSRLSPEARAFVAQLQEMRPAFTALRDAAASGIFPGLTAALDEAEGSFDRIERVLHSVGEAAGDLAEDFAEGLAGPRGQEFLAFIEAEVPSALTELGHTVGNFTAGLAEMWMAFTPLNRDFSGWLLEASEGFDQWAQGLAQTEGFREFVDYIRTNGPQVADALGAIGGALLDIVVAAAPLGGPVLAGLEAIANVISMIAESDLGTPIMAGVAAMSLYSRATSVAAAANISFANSSLLSWKQTKLLGVAAGALALSMTDLDEKSGLSNTAMLAMAGTMAGPWGAAAGAAVGFALDFAAANDEMEASIRAVNSAFESGTVAAQKAALRDLKAATDEASAGFMDLLNPLGLIANPIDAAKSSFNLLSGATGRARDEYDQFEARLAHRNDVGQMLAGPLGVAEDAFYDADRAMRQFTRSFERLNNILTDSDTLIAYERALDDLAKTAKDNEFNPDFEKGRRGLERVNTLTQTAIDRSQALREAGDKLGAVRVLRRAVDDLTEFGKRSPEAKAAVEDLIRELTRLDNKHAEPEIDADTGPAKEKLSQVEEDLAQWDSSRGEATATINGQQALATLFGIKAGLDNIQSKTVFVNVKTRRSSEGAGSGYGPGFRHGGFTGWRRPDEPAGVVHGREFVFSEPATRGNIAMLDRLHRQLRGYRDGGYVGSMPQATHNASTRSERVVERIVERLPDTIVLDAGELGRIVVNTADGRINTHQARSFTNQGRSQR